METIAAIEDWGVRRDQNVRGDGEGEEGGRGKGQAWGKFRN